MKFAGFKMQNFTVPLLWLCPETPSSSEFYNMLAHRIHFGGVMTYY